MSRDCHPCKSEALPRIMIGRGEGRDAGFSLVELLMVICITALLAAGLVQGIGSLQRGLAISRAATMVSDTLVKARQLAISRCRVTEVRFYKIPPEAGSATVIFRALQIRIMDERGEASEPVGNLVKFPAGTACNTSAAFSPLLNTVNRPLGSSTSVPGYGNTSYSYNSFRYLPNGSTDLSATPPTPPKAWCLTVVNDTPAINVTSGSIPKNYACITVNPLTGKPDIFRP